MAGRGEEENRKTSVLGIFYKPNLMAFTLFQGHMCVSNINCRLCFLNFGLDSHFIEFKCGMVATLMKMIMHNMNCATSVLFNGDNLHFFDRSSVWVCRKF